MEMLVSINLYQQRSNIYGDIKAYFSLARMAGWAVVLILTTGVPQCARSDWLCAMVPAHGVKMWMTETGEEQILVFYAICRTDVRRQWDGSLNCWPTGETSASGRDPDHAEGWNPVHCLLIDSTMLFLVLVAFQGFSFKWNVQGPQ